MGERLLPHNMEQHKWQQELPDSWCSTAQPAQLDNLLSNHSEKRKFFLFPEEIEAEIEAEIVKQMGYEEEYPMRLVFRELKRKVQHTIPKLNLMSSLPLYTRDEELYWSRRISVPCPGHANSPSIAQAVERDNEVYPSYEQFTGHTVECRIGELDNTVNVSSIGRWTTMVKKKPREKSKFDSLPEEIQAEILKQMSYEQVFQMKSVSREFKRIIECEAFQHSIPEFNVMSLLLLYMRDGELFWSRLDSVSNVRRQLPALRFPPYPGPNLCKDFLVSSTDGLLCVNISKSLKYERIVVCNPLTQTYRNLPPLNFPRNPVLLQILVNASTNSYIIIAAGSSDMAAEGHLSKKTEVFSSLTSEWEVTDDIPTCDFGLNAYQTGVCIDGVLFCIAFLEDGSRECLLAYDVEQRKWLSDSRISLPFPGHANSPSIAQLVECDNEVYLFSEQDTGRTVKHCIHKLDITDNASSIVEWRTIMSEKMLSCRGLRLYPEYACVGFGVGKLCIFNTLEYTGKVYDIRQGGAPEPLPPPQTKEVEVFRSLNPLSFTFKPSFKSLVEVCKRSV